MLLRKFAVATLLCGLFTLANAQTSGLDGTWLGETTHEGVVVHMEFTFHVKGDTFTGEARNVDTDQGGPISEGRIKGNQISFKTGNNNAIVVTGTLDGERLRMTINITDQGSRAEVTATRKKG